MVHFGVDAAVPDMEPFTAALRRLYRAAGRSLPEHLIVTPRTLPLLEGVVAGRHMDGWKLGRDLGLDRRPRVFGRDGAAFARERRAGAPLRMKDLMGTALWRAHHDVREAFRGCRRPELYPAYWRNVARVAARYLREALGSDELRQSREVPLENVPPEAVADTEPQVEEATDAVERWQALLACAGPRQRVILEAWRHDPDAPLAEVARQLGVTPNAARQAIDRLRRRVG